MAVTSRRSNGRFSREKLQATGPRPPPVFAFAGAGAGAGAGELAKCALQQQATYVETLSVVNCVVDAEGRAPVRDVAQRIENVGKQDVVLELLPSYFRVSMVRIYSSGSGKLLNRDEPAPVAAQQGRDDDFPVVREIPLKPGEAEVFKAVLAEIMALPPEAGRRYTIFMSSNVPFRRLGEPKRQAALLRMNEEIRARRVVQKAMFEGLVLR